MGCDIHVHVEVETDEGWIHMDPPPGHDEWAEKNGWGSDWYIGRCYNDFGMLAGVRGGEAVIEPRGVPQDVTPQTREDYAGWGPDAHTPSWWTLAELWEHFGHEVDESAEGNIENIIRTLAGYDGKQVRLVFWFDN